MSKGPKISIITACYNAELSIEQTIQSVFNQTYDNIEYIIVDGASTDGTMKVVEKYRNKIDIVISEPDKGVYDAFNKGLSVATGKYVQYLNSDDYLINENVIEKVVIELTQNNFPEIVYGGIIRLDSDTGYINITNEHIDITKKMIPHPATFVDRNLLLKTGGFDLTYKIAADYDLISKLTTKYNSQLTHIDVFISVFRIGGLSSDLVNRRAVSDEVKVIMEKYFGHTQTPYSFSNDIYLKKWLEKLIIEKKEISSYLKMNGINNIVIWGSGQVSNLLAYEFIKYFNVKYFIDNDRRKYGLKMNNIEIVSPNSLIEHQDEIDSIILGFEGEHEFSVLKQIEELKLQRKIQIYHWKELIAKF
ncbi:hypothetical protein MTP04_09540 [Lysinibacillus sp. PLM2]|nr:hypothetical protein MTP04_09540 [Lysinibacillus sp. PLM2]